MKDFIINLLERTAGSRPTVAPLLPSRYEQAPEVSNSSFKLDIKNTGNSNPERETSVITNSPHSPIRRKIIHQPETFLTPNNNAFSIEGQELVLHAVVPATTPSSPDQSAQTQDPLTINTIHLDTTQPKSKNDGLDADRKRLVLRPIVKKATRINGTELEEERDSSRSRSTFVKGTSVPETQKHSILNGAHRNTVSAGPAAPSQETQTIRVTIGRIDVRAVQQQPVVSQRKSNTPPRLSLDDYLKRHNEEKR